MTTIKVHRKGGTYSGANTHTEAVQALAGQIAHERAATVSAFTADNSGGTAGVAVSASPTFENVANDGGNLAQKADFESSAGNVADAIAEIVDKANAITAAISGELVQLTDNSGGAGADGTIAAIDADITAAATGVQATECNTIGAAIDQAMAKAAKAVNQALIACNFKPLKTLGLEGDGSDTIAAIPTDGGTAADPGVSKAAADAAFATWANNIASMAAKLDACATAGNPKVLNVA